MPRIVVLLLLLILLVSDASCGRQMGRSESTNGSRIPPPSPTLQDPNRQTVGAPSVTIHQFRLDITGTTGLPFAGLYLLLDNNGMVKKRPLIGKVPMKLSVSGLVLIAELKIDQNVINSDDLELRLNLEDFQMGFWASSSKNLKNALSGPPAIAVGNRCEPALIALLDPPLPTNACGPQSIILYPPSR